MWEQADLWSRRMGWIQISFQCGSQTLADARFTQRLEKAEVMETPTLRVSQSVGLGGP